MALREIIARFGFQFDQRGMQKADKGIGGLVGKMRAFGAVVAGSAVVRGVANFVDNTTKMGDDLAKTARQIGSNVDELYALQNAAEYSGASAQGLDKGLKVLSKNALLAEQGSKQAADAFKMLGVDVKDSSGQLKPATQLAKESGLALGAMADKTKAVALAQQIFGRSGAELLPMFQNGEKGLNDLLKMTTKYGTSLEEFAGLSEQARDSMKDFEVGSTFLKAKLSAMLLPAFNGLMLKLNQLLVVMSKNPQILRSLAVAAGLLAGVLAKAAIAKFGSQLLALGRAAVVPLIKFALLFLLVDDLIALFEGRGSLIGDMLDSIFGKGASAAVVTALKNLWKAGVEAFTNGNWGALDQALEDIFAPPGEELVKFVVSAFNVIKAAISGAVKDVGNSLRSMWEVTKAQFGAIITEARNFGGDLIQGIIDGILGKADMLANNLTASVSGALAALKRDNKIHSPSRLWADEVGAPLIEGAALGALRAQKSLVDATSMHPAMSAAQASTPSRGRSMGGVTFANNITLTINGNANANDVRQGVGQALDDNRRATLEALTQVAAV